MAAGPDPWIGGRGCDVFYYGMVHFHGDVMHRNAVKPSATSSKRRKLFEHAFLGQHRSTYCRGVQRCEMGCGLCGRAGRILFGLGGYFSGWEDTFGVVLGAAWKEMAQQQQQKGWKLGLGARFGLRQE